MIETIKEYREFMYKKIKHIAFITTFRIIKTYNKMAEVCIFKGIRRLHAPGINPHKLDYLFISEIYDF